MTDTRTTEAEDIMLWASIAGMCTVAAGGFALIFALMLGAI